VDLYEIVAEQKEIHISLESNDPLFIFADRKKLRQAIGNLVDNAIKYSPPGTTITLHLNKLSKNAFIKISDQGVGISDEEKPLIWKRLYRGQKSRHEKGIGLGLSLVKSIIEAHTGSINVEDNLPKGTSFQICLPIG
jgi:signal transduction histidine kinase